MNGVETKVYGEIKFIEKKADGQAGTADSFVFTGENDVDYLLVLNKKDGTPGDTSVYVPGKTYAQLDARVKKIYDDYCKEQEIDEVIHPEKEIIIPKPDPGKPDPVITVVTPTGEELEKDQFEVTPKPDPNPTDDKTPIEVTLTDSNPDKPGEQPFGDLPGSKEDDGTYIIKVDGVAADSIVVDTSKLTRKQRKYACLNAVEKKTGRSRYTLGGGSKYKRGASKGGDLLIGRAGQSVYDGTGNTSPFASQGGSGSWAPAAGGSGDAWEALKASIYGSGLESLGSGANLPTLF